MGGGGGGDNEIKETADQVEQMRINAELWNFYKTEYEPVIKKYTARVTDPEIKKLEAQDIAGKINAGIMKNVEASGAVSENPVVNTKRLMDIASLESGAQTKGQGAVAKKQIGDTQNIINIGRGAATEASEGMGSVAAQSLDEAISDMAQKQQRSAVVENAIGSAVGTAAAVGIRNPKKLTAMPTTYTT